MYIPKYFVIQELVPPAIYEAYGDKAWQFLDERLLVTLDALRTALGPMIINTWHSEKMTKAYGSRTESGLRSFDTRTGAKYSQHKFGRAADIIFTKMQARAVREYILAHKDKFPYITAMEDDVSWVHIDVRNVHPITMFKP